MQRELVMKVVEKVMVNELENISSVEVKETVEDVKVPWYRIPRLVPFRHSCHSVAGDTSSNRIQTFRVAVTKSDLMCDKTDKTHRLDDFLLRRFPWGIRTIYFFVFAIETHLTSNNR